MMRSFILVAASVVLGLAVASRAGDDIVSKMVNDPSQGWGGYGSGVRSELIDDAAVQGGKAVRLTVTGTGTNPWDAGARVKIVKPLQKGDVLLLAFWAKAETPPAGASTVDFTAEMQNNAAPYTWIGSAALHVGPQWKMYFVVATADKDYEAKQAIAQLNLAIGSHVIDLGPLFILNYGQGYDVAKLPHS